MNILEKLHNFLKKNISTSQYEKLIEQISIVGRFFVVLYIRFFEDGCTYRAAALTYTTLLSLVPLMTVIFAILTGFPVFHQFTQQFQSFIFSHFVATSGEVIQQNILNFVRQTQNLSVVGSFFLVITAILLMFNMERAFNQIWKVKSRAVGISTFMMYWAVLTLSPVLVGLSLAITGYITALPYITTAVKIFGIYRLLPFLLNLTFFTLIYVMVPNTYVPFRYGFIGALVATILFSLAKLGFGWYIVNFSSYALLYGALAIIPIFLVWLYIIWVIILFGVILSSLLANGYRFRSAKKLDGFTQAYRWLGYFYDALQKGEHLSLGEILMNDNCNYQVEPSKQIKLMSKAGLIKGGTGEYVLSQDLTTFTLQDLLYKLPWRLPTETELKGWHSHRDQALHKIITKEHKLEREHLDIPLAKLYSD